MNCSFDVWDFVRLNEGSVFVLTGGKRFTYTIKGNSVIPSSTNWRIPRKDIESAYQMVPFKGPGVINQTHQGPAYVWSIVHGRLRFGKYARLHSFLSHSPTSVDEIRLGFRQVELILGFPLPLSARKHIAWWGNDNAHVQAESWIAAGFKCSVSKKSLAGQEICFKRANC